ncbi:Crp/Fnr family transcriptional regulator [Chitinophaga sp. CF418]|uniref:Crp/Fnr family transcriptional regulator n=1 Tax=Chitinophaga sp. CF418 TaxID=1855287 RepID=UPI0009103901|nr:Crp/Fnr family transcriptional regulator [Chitinophaga sp. CF418]SHN41015.1 cAMP-binding domain of CRP or a regulatory subunit of cAMP-dependent protein kinases [Chitinophaga sp. CF418]
MENLLRYLNTLMPLSDESVAALMPALTRQAFRKNEYLLQEGQVCHSLFYIDNGYCRSYHVIDGIEKNTGFFFENDIATNINSFGSGKRSELNIIACEPLTAVIIDRDQLFRAAAQAPEIETLGRLCIRLFASKQEEFSTLFKLYSASERLEYVEKHHPHMLQRVSLTQLSSFLGVARETLSRIRKRRAVS